MGDVIALKRPGEKWASGPMRCLRCKYENVAVRQVTADYVVDCPECECNAFVPSGTFDASEGEAVWVCGCGCDVMKLLVSRDGAERLFCIGCGNDKPVKS